MLTSLNILQDCVSAWSAGGLRGSVITQHLDPCLIMVLTKFGDASSKVRGEASQTLSFVADSTAVGASHVAMVTMKVIKKVSEPHLLLVSATL